MAIIERFGLQPAISRDVDNISLSNGNLIETIVRYDPSILGAISNFKGKVNKWLFHGEQHIPPNTVEKLRSLIGQNVGLAGITILPGDKILNLVGDCRSLSTVLASIIAKRNLPYQGVFAIGDVDEQGVISQCSLDYLRDSMKWLKLYVNEKQPNLKGFPLVIPDLDTLNDSLIKSGVASVEIEKDFPLRVITGTNIGEVVDQL